MAHFLNPKDSTLLWRTGEEERELEKKKEGSQERTLKHDFY